MAGSEITIQKHGNEGSIENLKFINDISALQSLVIVRYSIMVILATGCPKSCLFLLYSYILELN